ncbi:MAG: extracellular solute-binding protein [Bacillota bacterium]|jgi:molybdate/tungstate transport system substrate-binding protein
MLPKPEQSLTILHAGALRHPLRECARLFGQKHPRAEIRLEAAGSLACARRLLEGRHADVVALADPMLFEKLLVPRLVQRYFVFAIDQMVITFDDLSRHSRHINPDNWMDVLLEPEVTFGRSDHNLDPAGYRTLMLWRLAEQHYGRPGLFGRLNDKCRPEFIYAKSVDLTPAIREGRLDYGFQYRSVARQESLRFLRLPERINLSNPAYAGHYAQVSVELDSPLTGLRTMLHGAPVEFAAGCTKQARNRELAEAFLELLISRAGQQILEESGLVPY